MVLLGIQEMSYYPIGTVIKGVNNPAGLEDPYDSDLIQALQGGPSGCTLRFVDIKFRVAF